MAGPNGSGKSTILQEVRKRFDSGPFVNADEIHRELVLRRVLNLPANYDLDVGEGEFDDFLTESGLSWVKKAGDRDQPVGLRFSEGMLVSKDSGSSYDAALAADFIRACLLRRRRTFTFETVLSHTSKVDFLIKAKQAGFRNYLYFICTVDPAINVDRVRQRVLAGGHSVPEDKIVKRYSESLENLSKAIPYCHRVFLFDNSTEERSIDPVAEIDSKARLTLRTSFMPWWVDDYVLKKLYGR